MDWYFYIVLPVLAFLLAFWPANGRRRTSLVATLLVFALVIRTVTG